MGIAFVTFTDGSPPGTMEGLIASTCWAMDKLKEAYPSRR